jgi:N-acetylmuramoyl-L-alanine amidase
MMTSDSSCVLRAVPSPNHDARAGDIVDILVLHYTGMESGIAAQDRLCDAEAKVSSHYLVYENGETVQLVSEARRARHAGVSSWQGWTDINSRSIGIEIVNGGHDYGCPDFPPGQIEAVIRLCKDIGSRWPIPQERVLAHSDVAPSRKRDPGEKFPWQALHAHGVGLWVEPEQISAGAGLKAGDSGPKILQLKAALSLYGYGVDLTNVYDAATADVVTAFQRHFRPQRVDGVADISTLVTLERLNRLAGQLRADIA